jgi:hypothetical protein
MLANGVELTGFSGPHPSSSAYANGPHGALSSRLAQLERARPIAMTMTEHNASLDNP